jgi:hypothetical protein
MDIEHVEQYLRSLLGEEITVSRLTPLGKSPDENRAKCYGYGTPIRVDYEAAGGERRTAVIHIIGAGPFGHEHMADRAQILLWQHKAFNCLPRHLRALDIAGFDSSGGLTSLGGMEEFCLLTEYAAGEPYAQDLERIRQEGEATALDLARTEALCDYLADIHRIPVTNPGLNQASTSGASANWSDMANASWVSPIPIPLMRSSRVRSSS